MFVQNNTVEPLLNSHTVLTGHWGARKGPSERFLGIARLEMCSFGLVVRAAALTTLCIGRSSLKSAWYGLCPAKVVVRGRSLEPIAPRDTGQIGVTLPQL